MSGLSLPTDVRRPLGWALVTAALFLGGAGAWAFFAPISTSLRLNGEIASQDFTYDIQHPKGGRLESTFVAPRQKIAAGDLLFRFDSSELLLEREALLSERRKLRTQVFESRRRLGLPMESYPDMDTAISLAFAQRDALHNAEIVQSQNRLEVINARLEVLMNETAAQADLATVSKARLDRLLQLSGQGLIVQSDLDQTEESYHRVVADQAAKLSQLEALRGEARGITDQIAVLETRFEGDLAERLAQSELQLAETNARIARSDHAIAQNEVRAPVDGMTVELMANTNGLVFGPGQTLARISQPVSAPGAELRVPPMYIDQITTGQSGTLMIPGLPQREWPIVALHLDSISDDLQQDPVTGEEFYSAWAIFDAGDILAAQQALGDSFHLVRGMPAVATLEGRSTTLWAYLTEPITSLMKSGLQD